MQHTFRSYKLAVQFYRQAVDVRAPHHLKDQLHRAASSIVLNLAEGTGKESRKDRRRFYQIALGSVREVEAIVELLEAEPLRQPIDLIARHVYQLCKSLK